MWTVPIPYEISQPESAFLFFCYSTVVVLITLLIRTANWSRSALGRLSPSIGFSTAALPTNGWERVSAISGTRLGEWRKGLLKKSAQHLSDEEAYNIPVRIASYHKIDRYIPTAVLGPNIGKSFNLGPLYIQGP